MSDVMQDYMDNPHLQPKRESMISLWLQRLVADPRMTEERLQEYINHALAFWGHTFIPGDKELLMDYAAGKRPA